MSASSGTPSTVTRSTCTNAPRVVSIGRAADGDLAVTLVDQRALPGALVLVELRTVEEVHARIRDMTVRGAPAIGAAAAFGLALEAARRARASPPPGGNALAAALAAETKPFLDSARPTAVNLSWATRRVADAAAAAAGGGADAGGVAAAVLAASSALAEEDVAINRALARAGLTVIVPGARVLTICNTGSLATVDVGTALGVIYEAHAAGRGVHVWVSETRPRLQGARLTAWELTAAGVPMALIADSASGALLGGGKVDVFLFGADRVAANGDTANKVGTMKTAVVAHEFGVPAYACVPTSTIDLETPTGAAIEIEERPAEEVTLVDGARVAPEGVRVFNPAFDVTPAKYITGIITEEGVCYRPFAASLRAAKERATARAAAADAALRATAAATAAGAAPRA